MEMIKTLKREQIIMALASRLIDAVPLDFTLQQLRYWSSRGQLEKLRREIQSNITRTCTSEWWQMVETAKIFINPGEIYCVNEKRYPLKKVSAGKVHICRLGDYVRTFQQAKRILAKRNRRPATLSEALSFLTREKRRPWGWMEEHRGIYILQNPITAEDWEKKTKCLYIRQIRKDDTNFEGDELFVLYEVTAVEPGNSNLMKGTCVFATDL